MPAHDYPPSLMTTPAVEIRGEDVPAAAQDINGRWHVRRIGAEPSRYARDGALLESAVIVTHLVPMSGLKEVFGLAAEVLWPSGAEATDMLGVQVSLNGADYLAWDGAAWVEVESDGIYNTLPEFNDRCQQLEIARPIRLGFRLKLSTSGNVSPRLLGLRSYLEFRYNPWLDDLLALLRTRVEALRVPLEVVHRTTAVGARVPLPVAYTVDAERPFEVYDLTTDPDMSTNLFSAWDAGRREVVLTSARAIGCDVFIRCWGGAPLRLGRADEIVKDTEVPLNLVRMYAPIERFRTTGRWFDFKRGATRALVRGREWPQLFEVPIQIVHHTADAATALLAGEAIRTALSQLPLRMPATGETVEVLEETPEDAAPILGESIDSAIWRGVLRVQVHRPNYNEYEAVRAVDLELGSQSRVWERPRF